jgi:hypothetical protein
MLFTPEKLPFSSCYRHLIPETESENNLVRFLSCIDFQHQRPLRHCSLASPATALPGAKRRQKAKNPTCLGEALAETEARRFISA